MARSVNFRVFQDGGDEVRFSSISFRKAVDDTLTERRKKPEKGLRKIPFMRKLLRRYQ